MNEFRTIQPIVKRLVSLRLVELFYTLIN